MDNSWIKLHRKLLDNPIKSKPSWAWLWVILLLKAGHKETELLWDGGIIKLNPGQFVTGRKALSKESGIKQTTVEDILNYLEKQHQIRQQKTTKFRIITIEKWEEYQGDHRKSDIKSDNRATTERQQSDTINNDNNDKNVKKESRNFVAPSLLEVKNYCEERKNSINPEAFIDFYQSKGWKVGSQSMKDWCAAVRTWEKRNTSKPQTDNFKIPEYAKKYIK